ncbi:MAG: hypothetical protein K2K79_02180 [Paramuribaculum sp.]|nr:hypothetical protein [Paramuribaculum sp.]
MKKCKLFLLMLTLVALGAGITSAQTKSRGATRRTPSQTASTTPTAAPIALWINFNGGEDVRSLAHDDKNVYITMNYTRRMVIIEKATGRLSEIRHDNDIWSVVVADNKCYYTVVGEGLFAYDPVSGKSEGPVFGIDGFSEGVGKGLAVSPDGNYLMCNECVVDVRAGKIVNIPGEGRTIGINNVGGAYIAVPEPDYCDLEGERYSISTKAVVHAIYPDAVTGNTFWCCEQGVGFTDMVPAPESGIRRVAIPGINDPYVVPHDITRDDEGNFVITTNKGIIFGGKTLDDNAVLVDNLKTGVKNQYGTELTLNYFGGLVDSDGIGNIIFGSDSYACICIYNPKGLKGYTEIRGKAVRF